MRVWLLLVLLVCVAAAYFLSDGTVAFEGDLAEMVAELENA
jgi:hypothetical protein